VHGVQGVVVGGAVAGIGAAVAIVCWREH
jgi:hypothetical protein